MESSERGGGPWENWRKFKQSQAGVESRRALHVQVSLYTRRRHYASHEFISISMWLSTRLRRKPRQVPGTRADFRFSSSHSLAILVRTRPLNPTAARNVLLHARVHQTNNQALGSTTLHIFRVSTSTSPIALFLTCIGSPPNQKPPTLVCPWLWKGPTYVGGDVEAAERETHPSSEEVNCVATRDFSGQSAPLHPESVLTMAPNVNGLRYCASELCAKLAVPSLHQESEVGLRRRSQELAPIGYHQSIGSAVFDLFP